MARFSFNSFNRYQKDKRVVLSLIFVLLLNLFVGFFASQKAQAVALTQASIRLDRLGASAQYSTVTGNKILIVLKPTTVGSVAKVRVTFPTTNAFTLDTTAANFDTSTTGLPSTYQGNTLTAATVTGNEASAVSGGAVTFDVSNISSASNWYAFFLTCNATTCVTNPIAGDAGTHIITIETLTSGDAQIDTSDVAVDTLGTNGDQVTVTATVPATFNFTIADQSIALGTLSTGSVSSNAMSPGIDLDTNAANGYAVWIRSEGAAATLASASSGDAISSTDTGSPVTCAAGSECYVVDVDVTGSGSPTSEYTGGANQGGVISTTYEEIANYTAGAVDSDTIVLTAKVAISVLNEAASDYTDTWEVVGAGNF